MTTAGITSLDSGLRLNTSRQVPPLLNCCQPQTSQRNSADANHNAQNNISNR
jgi:hypothetical protein